MLGRELAAAGIVVVSGLARGVDGEAHRGALDGGGHTVAVLGCGIDRDYPAAHALLAAAIAERSLLVSEYGGSDNRRRGAGTKRSALITADFALEEGREVFAVPGEITSALSAGTLERQATTASMDPILKLLPATTDELVRATGLASGEVAAKLAELELAGLAGEGDGVYRAIR